MKTRIVIADEQVACRQMMERVLVAEKKYEIVAEAEDGQAALRAFRRHRPDVVIMELTLPELCGAEVLRRVRLEFPNMRVLVFSGTRNQVLIADALKCHPHGFVDKRDSLDTFLEGLRAIVSGKCYVSASASPVVFQLGTGEPSRLTTREVEVLQLVAESKSSKEIATRLGLATKTVENHRAHIMEKLNVHDTAGLTLCAVRIGLVS